MRKSLATTIKAIAGIFRARTEAKTRKAAAEVSWA